MYESIVSLPHKSLNIKYKHQKPKQIKPDTHLDLKLSICSSHCKEFSNKFLLESCFIIVLCLRRDYVLVGGLSYCLRKKRFGKETC